MSERERVQGGSENSHVVRVGDGGTDEKIGDVDGSGRVEDVTIFVRSDTYSSISVIKTDILICPSSFSSI